jgi:hypothetical protein
VSGARLLDRRRIIGVGKNFKAERCQFGNGIFPSQIEVIE